MRRNLVKEGTVLFADLYLKVEHCVWWGQGVAQADSSEKSLPRALKKETIPRCVWAWSIGKICYYMMIKNCSVWQEGI